MIYIFHGDNQFDSRSAFTQQLDQYQDADLLRFDQKNITSETVSQFLQSNSLFGNKKVLVISNLFSVTKSSLDKIIKTINTSSDIDVLIWQDKKLNPTQLKSFPQVKIQGFSLDNHLFACLNSIKPKNLKAFIPLYQKVVQQNLYDLFLYLLKSNIRKQLTSYSRFNAAILKRTYLQLIELDFQNKSGQLAVDKESALERIIINLIK